MDKIKITLIIPIGIIVWLLVSFLWNGGNQLGEGYWYDIDGKRIFGPDIDIPPVSDVIFNSTAILVVRQKPLKHTEEAIYEHTYNYPMGRDSTYYWIIYKKEKRYVGPILEHEYKDMSISHR